MRGEKRRPTTRALLALWIALSAIWACAVAADIYDRARVQIAMSRALELELDSCGGANCAMPAGLGSKGKWADVAKTYIRFDGVSILEWITLPPMALFACGSLALMARRRRAA